MLINVLVQLGYNVKLYVLCLGSLGNITKNVVVLFEKYAEKDSKQKIFWNDVPYLIL